MVVQITGNYTLLPDPLWRAVQLQEIYLECNTSIAPVNINLFQISALDYFWNVKVYVVDKSKNAENFPITINCEVGNNIDGNSTLVIGQNGGGCELVILNNSTWMAIETNEGIEQYKYATLPVSTIVSSAPDHSQYYGELYDAGAVFPPANYVEYLDNGGGLCALFYAETILSDGTLIYEAYEITPTTAIYGYWFAMQQDPSDPTKLKKVGQCQMTLQFWNNYYDYTYQTESSPNEVKFLLPNYPTSDTDVLQTLTTTLKLVNGVLGAEDSIVGPSINTLTLYNYLTGQALLTGLWTYSTPIYSMEDDYSRLMDGEKAGWVFYGEDGVGNFEYQVCYNILTGETNVYQPIAKLGATTNFNPATAIDETYFNPLWTCHPKGVLYLVYNQQGLDNGSNFNDVSALWSPQWTNSLIVKFLAIRDLYTGGYINSNALLFNNTLSPSFTYGFDLNHIYFVLSTYASATYGSQAFKMSRVTLDSEGNELIESVIPALIDTSIALPSIWESKRGIFMFWIGGVALETFSNFSYYYWNGVREKPTLLQSNNSYPTNFLGNRIYSTSSQLNRNATALTIQYDIYSIKF